MPRLSISIPTELGRGSTGAMDEETDAGRRRRYTRAGEREEPAVVRWLSCWASQSES